MTKHINILRKKFYKCYFIFQGSLIANMVMGVIILKKRYTLDKYISVGMITAGISLCTIVSSQDVVSTC